MEFKPSTPYVKRVIYKFILEQVLLTIYYDKPNAIGEQARQIKIINSDLNSITSIEFMIFIETDLSKQDSVDLANLIYNNKKPNRQVRLSYAKPII